MQIASEGLKGRVFECNLADLQSVSFPAVPRIRRDRGAGNGGNAHPPPLCRAE